MRTRSEVLARCHLRHTTFAQAERGGQLEIDGPRPAVRAFLDVHPAEPVRRHGVSERSPSDSSAANAGDERQRGGGVSEAA